jgi:hypothetical protein
MHPERLTVDTVAKVEIDSGQDVTSYITNLFHELGVEDPSLLTPDEQMEVFVAAARDGRLPEQHVAALRELGFIEGGAVLGRASVPLTPD